MRKKSENAKLIPGRKASKGNTPADVLLGAPPGILRLIADSARSKGPGEQLYWGLVRAIASDVAPTGTFDYFAVIDVAEATYDSFALRKARGDIIERMRERYGEMLALQACRIASEQRTAAKWQHAGFTKYMEETEDPEDRLEKFKLWLRREGNPNPPDQLPPYDGVYSKSDLAKFARPVDTPADDGQVFLDSMDALERIESMISRADKCRDKALDDLVTRRRNLGELLRASSNRIIDGTINVDDSDK